MAKPRLQERRRVAAGAAFPPCASHAAAASRPTVTLKIKFADFQIITRSRSLLEPISDRSSLAAFTQELLAAQFPLRKSVRLIGVSLSSLGAAVAKVDKQILLALYLQGMALNFVSMPYRPPRSPARPDISSVHRRHPSAPPILAARKRRRRARLLARSRPRRLARSGHCCCGCGCEGCL